MKIELKNISKTLHLSKTIDQMNVTIEDGELVALLGPSGSGKSTTLLMMAGIYKPTDGGIYFDDQWVNDVDPKDRQIGMVFQSYDLYPHMNVLENIAFPLKQQKVEKSKYLQRAREAARMLGLEHLLDGKPNHLSEGEQLRVALARAIVKKPKILLLDDPLSNLDARSKLEMKEKMSLIQKELGITTVLATHDPEEAMMMADRIAVIKEGKIIQYGTPLELYNQPEDYFVAHWIGHPPMNFLLGKMIQNRIKIGNGELIVEGIEEEWNHIEVKIGMRPHDMRWGDQRGIALQGTVILIEPLGHSQMVTIKVDQDYIRFFTDPNYKIEIGKELKVSIDPSSIHLFDAQTGKCVKKDRLHCLPNKAIVC